MPSLDFSKGDRVEIKYLGDFDDETYARRFHARAHAIKVLLVNVEGLGERKNRHATLLERRLEKFAEGGLLRHSYLLSDLAVGQSCCIYNIMLNLTITGFRDFFVIRTGVAKRQFTGKLEQSTGDRRKVRSVAHGKFYVVNLITVREAAGLTQQDLASRSRFCIKTVYNLEAGCAVRLKTIKKLKTGLDGHSAQLDVRSSGHGLTRSGGSSGGSEARI